MTKADLVEKVVEKVGLSARESHEMIEIIFDSIQQSFVEGQSVKIPGFGSFNIREKRERRGRNPQTGEELTITPRRVLSFRPSNMLKEAIENESKKQAGEE